MRLRNLLISPRRILGLFAVTLFLGTSACSTSVGPGRRAGDQVGLDAPGAGNTSGTSGGAGVPLPAPGSMPGTGNSDPGVPVVLPAAGALGPIALRRLTTIEYQNTVQALLGTTTLVTQSFLPDELSLGFTNMAEALRVPPAIAEQYQRAAKSLASEAVTKVASFAPCPDAQGELACGESFISRFGQQAFRRPLRTEEVATYLKVFSDERTRSGYAQGIGSVVEAMLQSPHFLYKTEIGTGTGPSRMLSQYELASQLSYLVTGSMPDAALFTAAQENRLATSTQREAEVRRLMVTPAATSWLRAFVLDWLDVSKVVNAAKDPVAFPSYDANLHAAIVQESHRFVDAIFNEANGSLVSLFNANWSYTDGTLAQHYGTSGPTAGNWQKVTLPSERVGILTQAAFLTAHSKANDSFPIVRGKILRTRVLCAAMPPPPAGIKIEPVPPSTSQTTRERFAAHSANPTCASCHTLIDPLGFGFENYDAVGSYRTAENGKPIDSSGEIKSIDPEVDGPFANGVEFANRIAQSQVLKNCISREAFRWGLGRANLDLISDTQNPDYPKYLRDKSLIESMSTRMAASNSDIRELLTALVGTESFAFRSNE